MKGSEEAIVVGAGIGTAIRGPHGRDRFLDVARGRRLPEAEKDPLRNGAPQRRRRFRADRFGRDGGLARDQRHQEVRKGRMREEESPGSMRTGPNTVAADISGKRQC